MILSALEELVRAAKATGDIRGSLDERAAARFLHSTLIGLRVIAKGGAKPDFLRDVADTALEALHA